MMKSENDILGLINKIPLFSTFSARDRRKIADISEKLSVKKGKSIFNEGEKENSLYIIVSGKVNITKSTDSGGGILLAELNSGDFFGEMELLQPSKTGRTASAIVVEDTELIRITNRGMENALNECDMCAYRLVHFFAKVLCERLRRMDEEYTRLFLEYKGKNKINELKQFREKLIKEWGF